MLELDLLLRDFLEHGYERMDEAGQHNFARLLELPDQELFDYLMEQKTPRERGIANVIEKICRATKA
jgi:succinate dehydrogenase flavin-adding protein (antitoxin of CptAB toxin-antitoxin module)